MTLFDWLYVVALITPFSTLLLARMGNGISIH